MIQNQLDLEQQFKLGRIKMKRSHRIPKQIGNYIIDEDSIIGKGSYGKIHIASKKDDKIKIACKVISKKPLINLSIYNESMMKQTQEQFERQITFHQRLNDNKHIVKLYDFEQDKDAYYLFMEYCDSDMAKLMEQKKKLPEAEALEYIKQLCLGYSQIYVSNASHRDLKPQNLLLQNGVLKIADFGFVKELNLLTESITRSLAKVKDKNILRTSTLCGTPEYIPPNMVEAQNNTKIVYDPEKFDMWSIGIIFYFFLYGRRPFEGRTQDQLFNSIQTKPLEFSQNVLVSESSKSIIKKLLNKNEEQRLEFRLLMKQLNLPYPSKQKRLKQLSMKQKNLKTFQPIQQQADQDKIRKVINNRLKYLQFLNNLITSLYNIHSTSAIFKRIFSNDQRFKQNYVYKVILRLHELRLLKISTFQSEDYRKKVVSEINMQHRNTLSNFYQTINQFHRLFYDEIKITCGLTEQSYEQLEYLLKCLSTKLKVMNQYECYEVEITKILMLFLGLELYFQKKIYLDRLLQLSKIDHQPTIIGEINKMLS